MILNVLKEACRQVRVHTRGFAGTVQAARKMGLGAGGDISRRIDLMAERTVIGILRKRGIDATIIGEECGRIKGGRGFVVMDAIDGTSNAIRGIPFFCCSIAYATDFALSSVTDAAVIDLVRGDLYHASKNKGAFLNGRKIAAKRESKDPVIGINISGLKATMIERLMPVMSEANHVRQFGANALEMCYLARGFLDAYIDFRGKIRPTDIAGAYLIASEAGGMLYSDDGSQLDSDLGVKSRLSYVAAANNKIFRRIAAHLFDGQLI